MDPSSFLLGGPFPSIGKVDMPASMNLNLRESTNGGPSTAMLAVRPILKTLDEFKAILAPLCRVISEALGLDIGVLKKIASFLLITITTYQGHIQNSESAMASLYIYAVATCKSLEENHGELLDALECSESSDLSLLIPLAVANKLREWAKNLEESHREGDLRAIGDFLKKALENQTIIMAYDDILTVDKPSASAPGNNDNSSGTEEEEEEEQESVSQ